MNCKPGDLARIVVGPHRDKFIRLTVLDTHPTCNVPCWMYEGARLKAPDGNDYASFKDSILRPIRDPGDDARDETLEWLPVPRNEKVPHGA